MNDTSNPSSARPIVVGIGASAGGIKALQTLLSALPAEPGAAFVIVVHLDPQLQSQLPEILAARTTMPVIQVKAAETLQPNRVYVISPNQRLNLTDHQISTEPFDHEFDRRSSIDHFFRSLGQHGDGFAVILTGASSDGAVGARAVKEAGGLILVQDPNEAEFPSMPRAAIATGLADFVLPLRELSARLLELIRSKSNGSISDGREFDEDQLRRVLAHLRVRTGHDFSKYKRSTILRRIARRMQVTRSEDLQQYHDHLRESPDEAQALLSDLLISVTTFFRDPEAFQTLCSEVMPQLFAAKDAGNGIRVWVPGCATGEEAYTIAILLFEEATRHETRPSLQIFATDMDTRALAIAREGRFPTAIQADVSEERLRRFFVPERDGYRIRQEVRDVILFASHDLLKDPPFSRVDLISCRNLLIYLDRELQDQVIGTFHYALNPGGFMMLGSSETAEHTPGLFRLLDRNARIYQSAASGDRPRLLPRLLGGLPLREQQSELGRSVVSGPPRDEAMQHRRALEKLAPPSILVDQTHRVLHLSETAGRFISPSGGTINSDAVDLVRPELRFELRSALHRAFDQCLRTISLPIPVRFNGSPHRVLIHVDPLQDGETGMPRNALVVFIEGDPVETRSQEASDEAATDETVRRLTLELELTQGRLRTVREESEAANEELRAANEELQSINEEYRSTSEELETSKEELQSINEELQTVNTELKLKLEAISRAHSDLQNLMAATDIGTLFLDPALRVKRFTERVTDLFSLTEADQGRPISDFAHQLDYDGMLKDARAVLADLAPIKREVHSRNDRWYEVRLRPYRTVDNKIDGVVITFLDMTERRGVEEALRESERKLSQLKRLVDLSHDPIFVWDFDDGIVEWNRGSQELYGYSADEAFGREKLALLQTVIPNSSYESMREELLRNGSWAGELQQKAKDGTSLTVESRLQLELLQGRRLVLESTRDISERKAWEDRQRLLLRELTHRVKNTLAVVQAIAQQTLRTAGSSEDFVDRFTGRLTALAKAHGLLIRSNWQGVDLGDLAHQQLDAYSTDGTDRLVIEGEPVLLEPEVATPFGLVLHELATNAAKYGAFSQPQGRVHVGWTVLTRKDQKMVRVTWSERQGPAFPENATPGLGSALIENSIPDTTVTRTIRPDGVDYVIEFALPKTSDRGETQP